MATFIQLGNEYLNLDRITSIEIMPNGNGAVAQVKVEFAGGGPPKHYGGPAAQELAEYLRTHKVK